jgi:type IV pilus assembly protein PilE
MVSMPSPRLDAPGFTLVELLIVIAVTAVLAASAAPSFVDYIRRARINEAVIRLSDYRVRMEQYFLDNRRYDDGAGNCGAVAPTASPADAFDVVCTAAATTYTIAATGLAAKSMQGFVYTLDHANAHRTASVPVGWVSSDVCWVVRRDGSCT